VHVQPRPGTDATIVADPSAARPDANPTGRRGWRGLGWVAIAFGVVAGAAVLGAMVGPAGTSVWRVPLEFLDRLPWISIDSGVSDREWSIIWNIRMPRVVLAGIVGAMLAVGGTSYQGVFRNPLVDPYLLGAAAGAGLGATIVIAYRGSFTNTGWPIDPVPLVAFAFAIVTVAITYVVGASFGGGRSTANLVLAGVAMVSLTTAIQTFILQRNSEVVRDVYSWILGRVNTASWADVRLVTPYVVVSCAVLFLHRRHLDLLRVGDEEATTLGVPVARVRLVVVVAATLGTAAVVAVSGLIGFVGLIVPHAVRLIAGSSYRRVLPLAAAFGAAFLILVDIPGRMLTAPAELPIGVVTAFFGAPFFIVLLRARQVSR
jgi:iron complex transport system permease protein